VKREDIEPLLVTFKPWLSRPNIVGMHVGYKQVGGEETDQLAVIVHVVDKKAPTALGPDDFAVPKTVELHVVEEGRIRSVAVPTDVIGTGVARTQAALDAKKRPCPGGFQIQGDGIAAVGTLGVNIVWGGRYRLLTNNHVISENGNIDATVYQPYNDLGYGLTKVTSYIPVATYTDRNEANPTYNSYDLAWCDITQEEGAPNIYYLGTPNGIRKPVVGERVRMVGTTTGSMRHANISSITLRLKMVFVGDDKYAWFENMILLDAMISEPGDSGAAYLADDNYVVGLNCGASNTATYGCMLPVS